MTEKVYAFIAGRVFIGKESRYSVLIRSFLIMDRLLQNDQHLRKKKMNLNSI